MDSIVVGVDGSEAAQAALDWVASRCMRQPARVHLVNVAGRLAGGRRAETVLADADRLLRETCPGLEVETHLLHGSPARELPDAAKGADLLVIGIDPDRPLKAVFGGWLPVRVAARATVAVCAVPTGWAQSAADGIAVGLSDDGSAQAALEHAAAEAASLGCTLHVVHAWREPEFAEDGPGSLLEGEQPDIVQHRAHLNETVSALRARHPGLHIESDLVRSSPAEALVRGAKGSAAIVIGTHHHGVFAGGFSGSIAQDVLWQTRSPVCIVPPGRGDDATR